MCLLSMLLTCLLSSPHPTPPHTITLETLEKRHLFCDHILHVCWVVFWLVHAVSSQQVSEEGFVTNGGVGMTTWGGRGGGICGRVIIGKSVVPMHTPVLTQGYFPQNNTKRPPEQETSNNQFMWRETHTLTSHIYTCLLPDGPKEDKWLWVLRISNGAPLQTFIQIQTHTVNFKTFATFFSCKNFPLYTTYTYTHYLLYMYRQPIPPHV